MNNSKIMRHQAMKLKKEIDGVAHNGRTAYALVKDLYGLKGGRQKVYDSLMKMIRSFDEQQEAGVSC